MNKIPLEFLQIIENDTDRISLLIDNSTSEEGLTGLHMELDGKYQACIKNWDNSMYGWVPNFGFSYEYMDGASLLHNLKMMQAKLTAYKFQVNAVTNRIPQNTVNVNVDNKIEVNISFESVRSRLEADTSLSEEQTIEAKQKIDEIEAVIKSDDSKKNKWKKLKPVLLWLADKSVDIGTAVLSLLLKIQ
ncbi:hypothetical protein [Trichococcus shcherbakoviae]|uniref:hypothetical protein n=1 Tax=Trichococcus shcherbakoviae TaxID=2094020 RepID=UPI002AA6F634|nr:hypothetical protein [Trichococcus shcherbakoviae]